MPRTATTFLQRNVFPRLPHFHYYGPPYTQINAHFNCMLFEDDSSFDSAGWRSEVASLPGEQILLSNENFVGQSLYWHFGNRTKIAERLHQAMPDATIVLFLRNQPDLMRSLYLLSLQESETKSIDEYFIGDLKQYELENYRSTPAVDLYDFAPFDTYHAKERLSGFDYLPLIERYRSLFPRVEVLLFEDFKANPKQTFQRLAEIFEVDIPERSIEEWIASPVINSSTGQSQANHLRRLNRWKPVLYRTAAGRAFYVRAKRFIMNKMHRGKDVEWSARKHTALKKYYGQKNTLLHKKMPGIGLDRHAHEYLLE